MSTTIRTQPAIAAFCHSPVLYNVYETLYASAGFFYVADVYLWKGGVTAIPGTPTHRLEKAKGLDNSATFEISELILAVLEINLPDTATQFYSANNETTWIEVHFGYYTTAAGYVYNTATSSTLLGCFGYTLPTEGVNGNTGVSGLLTSNPYKMYVGSSQKLSLSCFRHAGASTPIERLLIEDDAGLGIGWNFPAYDNTSQMALQHMNIGTDIIYSIGLNPSRWYKVMAATALGVSLSPWYYVHIVCDGASQKNDPKLLAFTNRFGVQDYIHYAGRNIVTDKVTRKEMYRSPLVTSSGISFVTTSRQRSTHSVQSERSIRMNTGHLVEGYDEVVTQMLNSREHWILKDGKGTLTQALQPITSSQIQLTSAHDKLIQFTHEFKYSYDIINTVR